jgi:hypothetical protein
MTVARGQDKGTTSTINVAFRLSRLSFGAPVLFTFCDRGRYAFLFNEMC